MNEEWAWNAGVVVVGFALINDSKRLGRSWSLKANGFRLPTVEEVRKLIDEILEELPGPPRVFEVYGRGQGGISFESHTLIEAIEGRPLDEAICRSIELQCEGLLAHFSRPPNDL